MFRRSALEIRVLILAPIGRDAELLSRTLNTLGIDTSIAPNAPALLPLLEQGVGAAIVADEAITSAFIQEVEAFLAVQPPWSDLPFIVLTASGVPTLSSHQRARELQRLGNVTLIERPVRPDTIESSARTALRARMRQYEIRSRQEALIQANADLEQFAHSASHDLREPLRSIGIYSDLLARDCGDQLNERQKEFLDLIHGGAKRMHALLTDLLSYARASSIPDEEFDPIDSMRPLNAALENLAAAIQESQAQIRIGDMPVVKIRESHLSQVFQNLLGNAIKYRKGSGELRVEISAHRADSYWVFSITDNGIGVPPAYKEAIFGIFKRLHANSKYSGTGMGLAICKRIVERYGGRIWVESESNEGSRFCFSLPG
jgi:signal transduction histidine kinase